MGGVTPRPFVRGPDPASLADVGKLRLTGLEQYDDGLVWLRYDVES